MACSIDHLKKVALEGFPLIDELYGRQTGKAHRPAPPPTRIQDHYYHHQKLAPNQYVYHGPQSVTVFQEPDTGSYRQIQTAKTMKDGMFARYPNLEGGLQQLAAKMQLQTMVGNCLMTGKTKQKQRA